MVGDITSLPLPPAVIARTRFDIGYCFRIGRRSWHREFSTKKPSNYSRRLSQGMYSMLRFNVNFLFSRLANTFSVLTHWKRCLCFGYWNEHIQRRKVQYERQWQENTLLGGEFRSPGYRSAAPVVCRYVFDVLLGCDLPDLDYGRSSASMPYSLQSSHTGRRFPPDNAAKMPTVLLLLVPACCATVAGQRSSKRCPDRGRPLVTGSGYVHKLRLCSRTSGDSNKTPIDGESRMKVSFQTVLILVAIVFTGVLLYLAAVLLPPAVTIAILVLHAMVFAVGVADIPKE